MSGVYGDHSGLDRSEVLEAWEVAVDRIEMDVIRAERALANDELFTLEEWVPPRVTGELPAALRARAEELLDRQRAVLARTGEKFAATIRHQAVVEELGRATRPGQSRPAYVDVSA